MLGWVYHVYLMDLEQERVIASRYPENIEKLGMIGVSNQYDTGSEEIGGIILYLVGKIGI